LGRDRDDSAKARRRRWPDDRRWTTGGLRARQGERYCEPCTMGTGIWSGTDNWRGGREARGRQRRPGPAEGSAGRRWSRRSSPFTRAASSPVQRSTAPRAQRGAACGLTAIATAWVAYSEGLGATQVLPRVGRSREPRLWGQQHWKDRRPVAPRRGNGLLAQALGWLDVLARKYYTGARLGLSNLKLITWLTESMSTGRPLETALAAKTPNTPRGRYPRCDKK